MSTKVKPKKKKAVKRKKLDSFPKIYRRLYARWREKVRVLHGDCCAISGVKSGDKWPDTGEPIILDCHHLNHDNACPALRFDALNGILLTKSYHKYGKDSAHRGAVWFHEWLRVNRPLQHMYVLAHRNDAINLKDREALAAIEATLSAPPTAAEILIVSTQKAETE